MCMIIITIINKIITIKYYNNIVNNEKKKIWRKKPNCIVNFISQHYTL